MDGTIQEYVLDMAADTKKEPLRVKQYDTNSRQARITLKMGGEPWTIPFGCQIHINVRKTDGTLADATCTRIDEHTVLTPITEQMTAVTGTQLGELYFLGLDGDIKSQSFPVVVYEAVMDQARMESSDDFQSLQGALRQVETSTEMADAATQYATAQGDQARDAAQRAEDAADSIQAAVDAAANAKACESNAKNSELAAVQTQQEVTDYVEAQKAAFVGYSQRESDSKYANALTATTTGEGDVTVEDAWTAPVLGLDVVGKSEQATTTGAQLLPQPQFNDTKNGITVKTQMDGGISITGTATSAIAFTVAEILLPAGTYILSGLSGLVVGRMYFQLVEISAQGGQFVGELAKVGPVASATVTIDRDVWARAEIKVLSGVTADSICYPMLNAGDTALPWEPYTGGAPSPSPEYPQDIISTGTVSTGKQLFNASTIQAITKNGVTLTNNGDGSIAVKGTATAQTSTNFVEVNLEPGQYRISGGNAEIKIIARVQDGETINYYSNNKFDVTISSNINIYMQIDSGKTVDSTVWPMLNTGDTALPWEPYTGGKPAPSEEYPQVINVRAQGVQLFDASGLNDYDEATHKIEEDGKKITIIGNSNTNNPRCDIRFIRSNDIGNFLGKKLYISGEITSGDDTSTVSISSFNGVTFRELRIQTNIGKFHNIEYAVPEDAIEILLVLRPKKNMAVFTDIMVSPVSLNEGVWEPYRVPQTVPIQLTEPLRGIGEYRDRIRCRDGVWGIERWITKLTLAGNEDWVIYDNSSYISFYTRNPCLPVSMNKREGLCEQLRVMTIGGKNLNTIWLGANNKVVYTIDNQFYDDTLEDKGLANWKAHLAESPLEIITYLDAPTWEPLPSATQQALNALTTYAGTTHLTITAGGTPADVTLEYVQDTQKAIEQHDTANRQYTDSQIAAIVAALPTATQAAIVDNQTTRLLQEV